MESFVYLYSKTTKDEGYGEQELRYDHTRRAEKERAYPVPTWKTHWSEGVSCIKDRNMVLITPDLYREGDLTINIRLMITDKLQIEELLARLTDYIAKELHLSTFAAVGAVCMSKVANELASGKIADGTSFDELSRRLLNEVTMAG